MLAQKCLSFYMSIHPAKSFLNSVYVFEVDQKGGSILLTDFNTAGNDTSTAKTSRVGETSSVRTSAF